MCGGPVGPRKPDGVPDADVLPVDVSAGADVRTGTRGCAARYCENAKIKIPIKARSAKRRACRFIFLILAYAHETHAFFFCK